METQLFATISTMAISVLVVTVGVLGWQVYYYRKKSEEMQKQIRLESEEYRKLVESQNQTQQKQLDTVNLLLEFAKNVEATFWRRKRTEWMGELVRIQYNDKVEINTRLIYRLLIYLGYADHALEQNAPVTIQANQTKVNATLDWLIYRLDRGQKTRPCLCIHTLEPNFPIDQAVIDQARSLAFGKNAPHYMICNGDRLLVMKCKVQGDDTVIDIKVDEFPFFWKELARKVGYSAIGKL